MSGIKADNLQPEGTSGLEFFGVDMGIYDDLCEPIDTGPCGPTVRLAIGALWSGANGTVFDGQLGSLTDSEGTLRMFVSDARRPDNSDCDDLPPAWFTVVMDGDFGP